METSDVAPYVADMIPRESIKGLGASLMTFERGEANATAIDFTIIADRYAAHFFAATPGDIAVDVYEYDSWNPALKRKVFSGKMENKPIVSVGADATAYYVRAVGWLKTYVDVNLISPTTGGGYKDIYAEDLINAALAAAGHAGGQSVSLGDFEAAKAFCSRMFYPSLDHFGGAYSITDKIRGICAGGGLIYLGVNRFLCSYNPTTRAGIRLASLRYTGSDPSLKALNANQWRICALEYDGGTIRGWAETTWDNVRDKIAHVKISFTWVAGNVISLSDTDLVLNYDRGYDVKSKSVQYDTYGGPDSAHWASGVIQAIGDATPQWDKTLGIPILAGRNVGSLHAAMAFGEMTLVINVGTKTIRVGDAIHLYRASTSQRQNLGRVTQIIERITTAIWVVEVDTASIYNWPAGTAVYWWDSARLPSPNLMLPGYREIAVDFDQPDWSAPKPERVVIERRMRKNGARAYYWPERRGEIDGDKSVAIDGDKSVAIKDAIIALGESSEPGLYKTDSGTVPPTLYYEAGTVPAFNVRLDGCRFANLPTTGYYVVNGEQIGTRYERPGLNTLMNSGAVVPIINEGNAPLECEGNIWLAQSGDRVFCAFNRWRYDGDQDNWFYQMVWGELKASGFEIIGKDRDLTNYATRPAREITGFTFHDNKYWFGVERLESRWVDTDLKIIWAAPPQDPDKPIDYDGGGAVAFVMIDGDHTDLLAKGVNIRVGEYLAPTDKEYLISESQVLDSREITSTVYSSKTYPPEKRTLLVLYAVKPTSGGYAASVRNELLDKYITVNTGLRRRGEICYATGGTLVVSKDGAELYGIRYGGESYDYQKQEWKGEGLRAEKTGRIARLALSGDLTGMPIVTLKNGKKQFMVTDISSTLSVPIPPIGEAYLRRYDGDDYTTAILYVNPVYEGEEFDVAYQVFHERHYVTPFVYKGELLFTETETNYLWGYTGLTWEWRDVWPEEPAVLTTLGEDVYALSVNGVLMTYSKKWPGYIEGPIGGDVPVDVFSVVAQVAKAADCFAGEEAGLLLVMPRVTKDVVFGEAIPMYVSLTKARPTEYRAVKITYNGGIAFAGPLDTPNDLIYNVNLPYISSYGAALEHAQRYLSYYTDTLLYSTRIPHDDVWLRRVGNTIKVNDVIGRLVNWSYEDNDIALVIESEQTIYEAEGIPIAEVTV